jgi:uncharacterized membrane protein YqiK
MLERAELMDISLKTITIDRRGAEGLICRDNIRADIAVTFFVRVGEDAESILRVASAVGCDRASDQDTLEEMFVAKFAEVLKTVGKQMDFEELYTRRAALREEILSCIGVDLNGFYLEDVAIDYLEMTPLSSLDPQNVLDAQGIRKVTEITSAENLRTQELEQQEREDLMRQEKQALTRELEAIHDRATACLDEWAALERKKRQTLDDLAQDGGPSPPAVLLGGVDAEGKARKLEELYQAQLDAIQDHFESQLRQLQDAPKGRS